MVQGKMGEKPQPLPINTILHVTIVVAWAILHRNAGGGTISEIKRLKIGTLDCLHWCSQDTRPKKRESLETLIGRVGHTGLGSKPLQGLRKH